MGKVAKLGKEFYERDDVVGISQELLGKVLCTRVHGKTTKAVITETEAYRGIEDKASHAYGNRRTKRTEVMYGPAGRSYVYLCYGIHHLFNVVTNKKETPHAVLVRAGKPILGESIMKNRRGPKATERNLMAGPGTISQALGITTALNDLDLTSNTIWIEDHGIRVNDVTAGPRIGVDYAGKDALLPYRFVADI